MKNENPFTCDLPSGFEDLSPINKLILVKAFKPEKIMHSFSLYVFQSMGSFFDISHSTTML